MNELYEELVKLQPIQAPVLPKALENVGLSTSEQIAEVVKTLSAEDIKARLLQIHEGFKSVYSVTKVSTSRKMIVTENLEKDLARLDIVQVAEDFIFI